MKKSTRYLLLAFAAFGCLSIPAMAQNRVTASVTSKGEISIARKIETPPCAVCLVIPENRK